MDDKALFWSVNKQNKRHNKSKLKELRAFFAEVHKELRKKGVMRKLLWEEYREKRPEGVRFIILKMLIIL